MITLFSLFIVIALIVGIISIFVWMVKAAFHLIPFLVEVALVLAAIYFIWQML